MEQLSGVPEYEIFNYMDINMAIACAIWDHKIIFITETHVSTGLHESGGCQLIHWILWRINSLNNNYRWVHYEYLQFSAHHFLDTVSQLQELTILVWRLYDRHTTFSA